MYIRRICRMCGGKYLTGTDVRGDYITNSALNMLCFEKVKGCFPKEKVSFDICHECYKNLLDRMRKYDKYIRENLSDIDKGIVTEYELEQKELPKNEK